MNCMESSSRGKLILIFDDAGITSGREVNVWAAVGVIMSEPTLGVTIGPQADNEYAVDPVGVAITNPSDR